MATARQRDAARLRARRRRPRQRGFAERHAGRILLLGFVSTIVLASLLLTAFGSGSPAAPRPLAASGVLPGGQPKPEIVATSGALQLQLPVAQSAVTALGYHRADPAAVPLAPVGRQGNAGLLTRLWDRLAGRADDRLVWFQLSGARGPGTSALSVGAAPGTDVYAPVNGTVVGISDFVLANRVFGARVDIRPQTEPSVVVSLTHLRVDPSLTVGSPVAAGRSKVGVVLDVARAERQALARYTQDAGNNVTLEVHPAATAPVG